MRAGTVAVLGATGKTGSAVAAAALHAGLAVRGTTRHPGQADGPAGVEWHQADALTGDGLTHALTGAEAAYLIVPNVHPAEVEMVDLVAQAATEAGVDRVVYHSVADPHDARMAHHLRKARAETVLRGVRPEAVVLRPCAYQQNLLGAALAGRLEVPYRVSAPFSLVDLGDIAEVAVAALSGQLEPGSTHVLGGPEELTVEDLARTATRVLGRPVTASSITIEQWRSGPGARTQGCALTDLLAMFEAYDQTGFTVDPTPLTHLLGRPPTTWTQLLSKETS
ncbi:SDR family oxidoreductase [Ornithinimicrobium pratense]|uniref:SDR family oxidoreductase n=1 Tax=Ornithinimicrobium pratense TaxID=2593973 RepID=UPI0017881C1D|nr:NmrA family NAD(P)-binding protein [Ornithinimicrobium pratense]